MPALRIDGLIPKALAVVGLVMCLMGAALGAPTEHKFTVVATIIPPPDVFPEPTLTIDIFAHYGNGENPTDPQGDQQRTIAFDGKEYAHEVTFPLDMQERRVSASILYPLAWTIEKREPDTLRLQAPVPPYVLRLYLTIDPSEAKRDTPARLDEAFALSRSREPDPDRLASAMRFLDWYHSTSREGSLDPNVIQLQVLLFGKMLAVGMEPSSRAIESITDLDSVEGFSDLSPKQRFRIADDLAVAFAKEDPARELEADGKTFYEAANYFFGQAVNYLLDLPETDSYRRSELPRAIQRKYRHAGDNGQVDDFYDTHSAYAEYFHDVRRDVARGFLSEWLDALMKESSFGGERSAASVIDASAQDSRLCGLWADYRMASELLHEAWSGAAYRHLATGNDLAISISNGGGCAG